MTTDAPGDSLEFVDGQGLVEITKEPKSAANELRIDENEVPDATGPPASGEALCTFTRSTVCNICAMMTFSLPPAGFGSGRGGCFQGGEG